MMQLDRHYRFRKKMQARKRRQPSCLAQVVCGVLNSAAVNRRYPYEGDREEGVSKQKECPNFSEAITSYDTRSFTATWTIVRKIDHLHNMWTMTWSYGKVGMLSAFSSVGYLEIVICI